MSQPDRATTASNMCPRATSSIESAITSRLIERGLHPLRAHRDAVRDRDGVELHRRAARRAHALLDLLGQAAQWKLQGIVSVQVLAMPTIGRFRASSSNPMPFRYARACARSGPSRMTRLRLRSSSLTGGSAILGPVAAPALPLGEAPEVAAHAGGVELAADQVHVRAPDHAVLVGGERHPLGEHVVRTRAAGGAAASR